MDILPALNKTGVSAFVRSVGYNLFALVVRITDLSLEIASSTFFPDILPLIIFHSKFTADIEGL